MVEERVPGRVLVVDDQENMCWVLSKLLCERGHVVRSAPTGARALAALDGFDCQVAVVDYRLPDTDGIALILKMTSRLPALRSILMTSYGNAELLKYAIDAKLFAFFDKPFRNDLIIHTIEEGTRLWGTPSDSLADRNTTRFPGRPQATQ